MRRRIPLVQRGNNGKPKKTVEAEEALAGTRILSLVAKGRTVRAASLEAGVSEKHGRDLYVRELAAATESNNGLRQQLVSQDLETLRLLIEAHIGPALGAWVEDNTSGRRVYSMPPDDKAAKVVLAALDRRSKLLGLDSAIKVEVSNARVSDVVDGVVALVDMLGEPDEDDEQKALPPAHEGAVREAG